MSTLLEQKAAKLNGKRQELAEIFKKSKKPDGSYDLTQEQVENVRARNTELTDLHNDWQSQHDLEFLDEKTKSDAEKFNTPQIPGGQIPGGSDGKFQDREPKIKTLGELVQETAECKAFHAARKGGTFRPFSVDVPFDTKTTMTETVAGFAPPNYRGPVVVFSAQRRPVVADLIPQDPTDKEAIKFMKETTYTNNAAMTAEANTAGEAALAYTETTVTVEWLPTILPVTEQQLDDVPQLNAIINNRLDLMIRQAEEIQLLTGDGTSPQLHGLLNETGVQTQALGPDPIPDAIFKALTLVRFTAFADPTGLIVHPTNWQTIRLIKTSIGTYLWGNPAEPGPERVFGLPAVVTPAITLNTALVGDFVKMVHISRRMQLRVEVGFVNDDFKRGQRTIRAQERLSQEIYRPAAFCTITGLP